MLVKQAEAKTGKRGPYKKVGRKRGGCVVDCIRLQLIKSGPL